MKFTELNLDDRVLKGIEDAGFEECTEVQTLTFEQTLKGVNVAVQSQTGTGKTAAFLITIFDLFLKDKVKQKKALVIVPTRELAVQIENDAKLLGAHLDFTIGSIYGGIGYGRQSDLLRNGVDLLIGTPGRLLDFNEQGKLDFGDFGVLVIDEADRLFDMGFYPDLRKMVQRMPPVKERTTMLFSATLSVRVKNLAWEYMHEPYEIEVAPENITVEEITQELYHVSKDDKFKLLLGILKKENPENALIFSNTKFHAVLVAKKLALNGFKAKYLMGDMPQKKRLQILNKLKAGEIRYLVATDVAARGLHIEDLSAVINYDVPEDPENYVHRIGRTARAGKTGKAITLACERYVFGLEAVESFLGRKIPVAWAEEDLYTEDASQDIYIDIDEDELPRGGKPGRRPQGRGSRGRSGGDSRRSDRSRSGSRSGARPGGSSRGRSDRSDRSSSDRSTSSRSGSGRDGSKREGADRSGSKSRQPAGSSGRHADGSRGSDSRRSADSRSNTGRSGRDDRANSGNRDSRKRNRSGSRDEDRKEGTKRNRNEKSSPKDDSALSRTTRRHNSGQKEKSGKKADKTGSIEERLAYYREKYGEDFKVTPDLLKQIKKQEETEKGGGIFRKIRGLFNKDDS